MTPLAWWHQLALVMAGGALGAATRFWIGGALLRRLGEGFPWGTLAANLLGSFAAGFLLVWLEARGSWVPYWRAFLLVGVLGAMTTFSALMVETLVFTRTDRSGQAFAYLAISFAAGLLLVWLGSRLALTMRAPL